MFRQCDRGPLKPRFQASFVLEQALIAARQVTSHPIIVSRWDMDTDMDD